MQNFHRANAEIQTTTFFSGINEQNSNYWLSKSRMYPLLIRIYAPASIFWIIFV